MKKILVILMSAFVLVSCGTQKAAVGEGGETVKGHTETNAQQAKLSHMRKVYDNAVYAKNIVSNIDFSLNTGGKDISVGGSLHMRKDDVIRIQLTALGLMEVGRLEFTKDYVMIVDRIHKQYVKADYNRVDFLKRNGLNFYSLQALLWNMLFVPGTENITDNLLKKFTVDLAAAPSQIPVGLKQGQMDYEWLTDYKSGQVQQANIHYADRSNGNTEVTCKYSDFKALGSKSYPNTLVLNAKTEATKKPRNITVTIKMKGVKTDDKWETRTKVSDKFKQVSVEEALEQITNL